MVRNLISLIVSEPRADPLTYPTQPGAGYIGFHSEKCAEESKFPSPLPSFLNLFSSPCETLCRRPQAPPRLLPGIPPVKIPGRPGPARRRRKRDETSKTVKCTFLRHVRFNCICGLLVDSIERLLCSLSTVSPSVSQSPLRIRLSLLLFTFPPQLSGRLETLVPKRKAITAVRIRIPPALTFQLFACSRKSRL